MSGNGSLQDTDKKAADGELVGARIKFGLSFRHMKLYLSMLFCLVYTYSTVYNNQYLLL